MTMAAILVIGLLCMGLQLVLEFLPLYMRAFWKYKNVLASLSAVMVGLSSGLIAACLVWPTAAIFILVQAYRVVNLLRIIKGRINEQDLIKRSRRTSWLLLASTAAAVICAQLAAYYKFDTVWIGALILLHTAAAFALALHVFQSLSKMKIPRQNTFLSDSQLPTLTVAIPARNETSDLTDCLQSLLASDYPKLEILVLDDCSQDNTSDIIRGFAHRGVRFLKGMPPPDNWLAKNYAYEQLLQEANGDIVLFCGVDVRFQTQSLRYLTSLLADKGLSMLTVLPRRHAQPDGHFLLQPMRYWREIALPQAVRGTPPALSTCWISQKRALQKAGGFEAYKRAIRPQHFFARVFEAQHKYHFYRNAPELGISSIKNLRAQWQTAVRTRYPELHQKLEAVFFWTLAELFVLVLPLAMLALGILHENAFVWIPELAAVLLLFAAHLAILRATTAAWSVAGLINLPLAIAAELYTLNYSMWSYEFSDVIWKGRNVCMPVMRSIYRLPKLNSGE